jgi:hypothetical protein
MSACGLYLELQASLLTAVRLSTTLLAALLGILKVIVFLRPRTLPGRKLALLAAAPAEFCLTLCQACSFRNA